jgi:predicted Zn finger-like uncharacterized protein
MRLTCPNCRAQYEVDDSAIPARGRDVQCSSCGHGWFERPVVAQGAPAPQVAADPSVETPPPAAPRPEAGGPIGPRLVPKRELDPAIAEVLRAEAAREAQQRRRDAAEALEEQHEFALEPARTPPLPAYPDPDAGSGPDSEPVSMPDTGFGARAAPGNPPAPEAETTTPGTDRPAPGRFTDATRVPVPRRDLLPDIEKINASLNPQGPDARGETAFQTPAQTRTRRRGRGFRLGFSVVLLMATAAVLVYGFAPRIAAEMPALAPSLEAYVTEVNAARLWINAKLVAGTEAFTAFLTRITS